MPASQVCGIYKITNPSGRVYIGQSIDVQTRFSKYRSLHCPGQRRLVASLKKYGAASHTFEIIEIVCDEALLVERERFWQGHFDVVGDHGLNCKLVTKSSHSGRHSQETRALIAKSNTGKRVNEAAREKMRVAKLGRKMPEAQRLAMVGRKLSEATKEKMRTRMLGNQFAIGVAPPNVRRVVCIETGMTFDKIQSAAEFVGLKRTTLSAMLRGDNPNRTSLRYA
jgi:group I intron endonuclease